MADLKSSIHLVVLLASIAISQGCGPTPSSIFRINNTKTEKLTVVSTSCETNKTGSSVYPDTNFTESCEGWTNKDGNRDWVIANSSVNDAGTLTGRQGVGDGFMVINPPYYSSSKAKLYSRDITGSVCMRFYFYLYGKNTGHLKILTKRNKVKSIVEHVVFSHYGNYGHKWNFAQVYLDFPPTDVYQVIIQGEVGDPNVKASIAVDDVSFENKSCEALPQESTSFNCIFERGTCGWKMTGQINSEFESNINQYTVKSEALPVSTLTSPNILQRKACFTFQYFTSNYGTFKARLFVFIRDVKNGHLLPFWYKTVADERGKWQTMKILLDYESGFDQVVVSHAEKYSDVYFADFNISPEVSNCDNVVEKKFFVSTKKSSKEYTISENGVHCDMDSPSSYFIARTIPSKSYPKPMYVFKSSHHTTLRDDIDAGLDSVFGYFYVSEVSHKDASAIYFKIQDDWYGEYFSEFRSSFSAGIWNGTVLYVKSHRNNTGNEKCFPGYFEAMGKCLWLLCDRADPEDAEVGCSGNFGTLASLNQTSLALVAEYLNHVEAISAGITEVTVGLSRENQQWIWNDGRQYKNSDGALAVNRSSTHAYLTWNEVTNNWQLKDYPSTVKQYHLCEKRGANLVHNSLTNQSSTSPGFHSQLAVDGLYFTCSLTQQPKKKYQYSWWKITLQKAAKIYIVQISWPDEQSKEVSYGETLVSVGLGEDKSLSKLANEIENAETTKSLFVCEPPTFASYVIIELKEKALQLCEVDVYGTDRINDLQGVMRVLWPQYFWDSSSTVFPQSFTFTKSSSHEQKLGSYFLAPYDGLYNFTLSGGSDANLLVAQDRTQKNILMKISLKIIDHRLQPRKTYYGFFSWPSYKRSHGTKKASITLEACKFYFVSLTSNLDNYLGVIKLNIQHQSGSQWNNIQNKNFFWALPGQVEVKLSLDNSTVDSIPLGYPVNVTGSYSIKCLGLYCGNCPLVIFITFANHIKCIMTSSRSIAQTDRITLQLKNWITLPVSQPVHMGYRLNGDCQSIFHGSSKLESDNSTFRENVGSIAVRPLTLVSCWFKEPELCRNKNANLRYYGWRNMEDLSNDNRKMNSFSIADNTTSRFSYEWIPYNAIVRKTGLCMIFLYKMTGDNNTLSVSFKTFSGKTSLVWALRGNHGNVWRMGMMTYHPDEEIAFNFEGQISKPNSTVAISNVVITTQQCTKAYPNFADADFKCDPSRYSCDNGQCIYKGYVCDGDKQCIDGSDETYCQCLADEFKCKRSGECVNKRQFCNGVEDCKDGSDEERCYESCKSGDFYCPNGNCIPWTATCNGIVDCPDKDDEPTICGNTSQVNETCGLNDLGCLSNLVNGQSCEHETNADCDFEENGFCEWRQNSGWPDDFDWSLNSGQTSSKGTGPFSDHTIGTEKGSYIYIETSSPRVKGDKAIIDVGPFKADQNYCFTFYYNMYGKHIGRLSVYQSWLNSSNLQLLWSQNNTNIFFWKSSSFDVRSEKQFYLLIEGVRGDGSMGDIAVDDIFMVDKNCSEVNKETSPFCSFEKPCSWTATGGLWKITTVSNRGRFMLQNNFMRMTVPARIERSLPKEMTSLYQCLTFWYKARYVRSFKSIQILDGNVNELWHSVKITTGEWVFGEMPLDRRYTKSKLVLEVAGLYFLPTYSYVGFDEINFSAEPCLSFQQGDVLWIQKSSRFYKSQTKRSKDKDITAFYTPRFLEGNKENLDNLKVSQYSQSFIKTLNPDRVNRIVKDIPSLDYSNISVGNRIFVQDSVKSAASGIVISKSFVGNHNGGHYDLTVRFESNSSDIVLGNQNVWLLPYQLEQHGPTWLTPSFKCSSYQYNGSCFLTSKEMKWFDGADFCKSWGGELARFDSELEEKYVKNEFSKSLPLWIGYHGHKYKGEKFAWSDGSPDVYNKLDKSLNHGLSAGLCAVVANSTLWERRHCSERLNVLCRRPYIRHHLICENEGNQKLNCSNLGGRIQITKAKVSLVKNYPNMCTATNETSGKKSSCRLKSNVLKKVKSMCEAKDSCSLSVKSIQPDHCPKESKYLEIWYKCVAKTYARYSETNDVFCPKYWMEYRGSCYLIYSSRITWESAQSTCSDVKGASLVSLNNNMETRYIKAVMKSYGYLKFHTQPRTWPLFKTAAFMCEYKLVEKVTTRWIALSTFRTTDPSLGSCDFEPGWCGWRDSSGAMESSWSRTLSEESRSARSLWGTIKSFLLPSTDGVSIYVFEGKHLEEVILKADRPKRLNEITLCLWVYIDGNMSKASVVSFGEKLQLNILYDDKYNFIVSFHEWNSTTKVSVSFQTWQHLCFSINAKRQLWMFFKNGLMADVGVAKLKTFSKNAEDVDDNLIYLGQRYGKMKSYDEKFRGKMTKPEIWSRVLNMQEISVLSTGCGMAASPDISVQQTTLDILEKKLFKHGQCIPGKGFRLKSVKTDNSSSPSISALRSPWMKVPRDRVRGLCMEFNYQMFGEDSELRVAVKPRNMKLERLWLVKGPQKDALWKKAQVSLGLVTEFRVYITAKHVSNDSKANIDNIFFKEDYCDPVPEKSQDWYTPIFNRSSGYITSPYYPSLYLNNMKRYWTIKVAEDQRIKLDWLFLNLEDDKRCTRDFVMIKNSRKSHKSTSFCGNKLPPAYVTPRNKVYIYFKSDEKSVGTGFKIRYRALPVASIDDTCQANQVPDCPTVLRCSYIRSNRSKVFVEARGLKKVTEYFPTATSVIHFDENELVKLEGFSFENLTQLEYLTISKNKLFELDDMALSGLTSLKTLRLSANFIKSIPNGLFLETNSLQTLDLSMNWISELTTDLFSALNKLQLLSLRKNFITQIEDGTFLGLTSLEYLYLDNNELIDIASSAFDDLIKLKTLILKDNKLKIFKASWLKRKTNLQTLDISKNNIEAIESGAFSDLKNLVNLDISNNQLRSIPEDLFENLISLRNVSVDHYTLCCYAKQNNPSVACVSKEHDGFSSCDELLKNTILKYAIWILGIMAFAGNLVVIIWRCIATDSNRVNSFLLTNLAVADFLMGVYMLIIAYKDTIWDGVYFKHDVSWRASSLCIFAGVISTVSSEVSVLTLTVITLDRLVCIVFPFRFRRWSMKKASTIMAGVWTLGLCIAIVPLSYNDYFYDYEHNVHFFGRSAVCLPLQLSSERPAGWQYSVFIFLILNATSFLFILLAYVFMYHTIVKAANAVRSTRMNQDSTLAKRMMFIILTDFACWFPVIVISILALTGNLYDPSKQVYAWIAVFVLPINSSINPLLYTFSTPYVRKTIPNAKRVLSRRKRRNGGKAPSRLFSNIDSINDNYNTMTSPMSTPQSLRKLEIINEGYIPDEKIAESSFTESVAAIDHRIRLVEDINLLTDGNDFMKSYVVVEVAESDIPCLLHICKSENEEAWKSLTDILSWLSLDGGHDNILHYLWSARGNKVLVEKQESDALELDPDDCVLCYELPSRQTLDEFIKVNNDEITEEWIYYILYDLIEAIDYLSTKKIVHYAIRPENVIIAESSECRTASAVLGGLQAAKFLTSSVVEQDIYDGLVQRNTKELERNVTSFGRMVKLLLDVCPSLEKFSQLCDIMDSCLGENKPSTSTLVKQFALMDPNCPPGDKRL